MLIQIAEASDTGLAAEGWERRFTADAARAKEAVELYTQLGYEVRAECARTAGQKDECDECYTASSEFMTIYTRRKSQ